MTRPSRVTRPSWPLGPPGPLISPGPLGSPAMPDPRSISLPGISCLSGTQLSLSGVRPTPGIHRHPYGVSAPSGQPQQQWSGAIPQGYSCPTPRGVTKFPWNRPLTWFFQVASLQLWSNSLLQLWNRTSVRSVGSLDRILSTLSSYCKNCDRM